MNWIIFKILHSMLQRITHRPRAHFFIISFFFIIAENKTEFTRLSSLSFQEAPFPPQLKKENDREKEAQEQLRDDRSREDDDSNSWPANQVIERPEAIVEEIG